MKSCMVLLPMIVKMQFKDNLAAIMDKLWAGKPYINFLFDGHKKLKFCKTALVLRAETL